MILPAHSALAGYPVHLADSQSARFSLGGISKLLAEKIQAGLGDASRWLKLFNVAYSEKLGMPVFPGSLNIALDHVFDWFDARYKAHTIWFDREEYGGERDILLLPCELVSLDHRRAFLWTPMTVARDRRDPWVVEIVADVNLRDHFGLQDGDVVEIRVPTVASRDEHGSENSQRSSPEASGMPPNQALQPTPSDAFFLQFTHLSAAVAKLHLVRLG